MSACVADESVKVDAHSDRRIISRISAADAVERLCDEFRSEAHRIRIIVNEIEHTVKIRNSLPYSIRIYAYIAHRW